RRIGHWSREDDGLNPGFKTYGDKSLDQFTLLKQVNLATQFMNMVGWTKTPGRSKLTSHEITRNPARRLAKCVRRVYPGLPRMSLKRPRASPYSRPDAVSEEDT